VTTEYLEKIQPHVQKIQLAQNKIKFLDFAKNRKFLYNLNVVESTISNEIQKLAIISNDGIINTYLLKFAI
jgi:hypothetical protein